jgi:hypothetical protein
VRVSNFVKCVCCIAAYHRLISLSRLISAESGLRRPGYAPNRFFFPAVLRWRKRITDLGFAQQTLWKVMSPPYQSDNATAYEHLRTNKNNEIVLALR